MLTLDGSSSSIINFSHQASAASVAASAAAASAAGREISPPVAAATAVEIKIYLSQLEKYYHHFLISRHILSYDIILSSIISYHTRTAYLIFI